MSTLTNIFSDIANALRSKMGVSDTYTPAQMAPAINNIPTGPNIDEYVYVYNGGDLNYGVHAFSNGTNKIKVVQYNDMPIISENMMTFSAYRYFADGANLVAGRAYGNETSFVFAGQVSNMRECFVNCYNIFDPNIIIGNSVTDMNNCFQFCNNFNRQITIPNSVTNMVNCFMGCRNFNQPVTIPNSVTDMSSCFLGCNNFNQPVTIPNSVTRLIFCFSGCNNFNQPVTIPNSVTSMGYFFDSCCNFNQPVTIPNSVTNMASCFSACYNFNQTVTIPDSVTNMVNCFFMCKNFKAGVYIGNGVKNMVNCFRCQTNPLYVSFFQKPTIFFNNANNITNCTNMFVNANNRFKKTIYCTPGSETVFMKTDTTSIVGKAITWTPMANGYYNATYNIYIYNNWTPT